MRPLNILWILTTQWRAQACGYAGDVNARTPSLDAFASESINFSQAVTPHPFGPFARAALLTGQRSPRNGVVDYFDPLPKDAVTIAHRLGSAGFDTAFFGKWHLAQRDRSAPLVGEVHAKMVVPPEARGGFSFWEGFESGFQLVNPWLHGTNLPEPRRFDGYQSDVIFERAGEWIEKQNRQPAPSPRAWFCVASVEPPHPPYDVLGAVEANGIRLRSNVPADTDVSARARRELAGYYDQIAATDRAIGRLLAGVDFSNTAVVFTSVHGDMHGSHGLFRKGWPHEESVRVPLLVRIPGQAPVQSHAAISLADVYAASLALAGNDVSRAEVSPGIVVDSDAEIASGRIDAGVSEFLKRREWAQISMPSVVKLPWQCDRPWRGVRSASRKLILNADRTPWLFFDLQKDPEEKVNLAAVPGIRDELSTIRDFVE